MGENENKKEPIGGGAKGGAPPSDYVTPSSDDVPRKSFDGHFDDCAFLADRPEDLDREEDDEVEELVPPVKKPSGEEKSEEKEG